MASRRAPRLQSREVRSIATLHMTLHSLDVDGMSGLKVVLCVLDGYGASVQGDVTNDLVPPDLIMIFRKTRLEL